MTQTRKLWLSLIAAIVLVLGATGLATAGVGPSPVGNPLGGGNAEQEAEDEEEVETDADDVDEADGEIVEAIPLPAEEGRARAARNRQNAANFVAAVNVWTTCAAQAAADHGLDPDFDPHNDCGLNPHPSDHGLGGPDDESETDEDNGPPAGVVPGGPPEDAGPPADAGPPGS